HRGQPAADPGLRGHLLEAPGLRLPRDVHGAEAVVRCRRRADVPAPLAEDREARGRVDRRRAPREALLLAQESGEESAGAGAPAEVASIVGRVARSSGQRLLGFDRKLGVRFVAGADEAGRGSLAGPLVVAGVLLDYKALRGARVRPLAGLNDSKQVPVEERETLFEAVGACASAISVRVVPVGTIARGGLPRSTLAGPRAVLSDLHPPADACLVDGFRPGPSAPPHRAVVDGDARSAAIAAASIVAKVVRDRVMRRLDALYPNYGFRSHVGHITPAHHEAVRAFRPSALH